MLPTYFTLFSYQCRFFLILNTSDIFFFLYLVLFSSVSSWEPSALVFVWSAGEGIVLGVPHAWGTGWGSTLSWGGVSVAELFLVLECDASQFGWAPIGGFFFACICCAKTSTSPFTVWGWIGGMGQDRAFCCCNALLLFYVWMVLFFMYEWCYIKFNLI